MLVKKTYPASMKPLWIGGLFSHMANMRPSGESSPFPWVDHILWPLAQRLPGVSPFSPPPPICLGSPVAPTASSPANVSNMNNFFHSLGTAQEHGLFSQTSKKVPFPLGFTVISMEKKVSCLTRFCGCAPSLAQEQRWEILELSVFSGDICRHALAPIQQ